MYGMENNVYIQKINKNIYKVSGEIPWYLKFLDGFNGLRVTDHSFIFFVKSERFMLPISCV